VKILEKLGFDGVDHRAIEILAEEAKKQGQPENKDNRGKRLATSCTQRSKQYLRLLTQSR